MRGKKLDFDFVGGFIVNCVNNNKNTQQEICQEAKNQITLLDEQIKKIETTKKLRSSLYDVLIAFDEEKITLTDQDLLPFFQIKNKYLARRICQKIQVGFHHLDYMELTSNDTITLTTMYNLGIIEFRDNEVYQGKTFDRFLIFVSKYYARIR